MRIGLALLLTLLSVTAAQAQSREFRAFAVAYKHELARSESYESFRAAIRAQFAEEIAPHLRRDVPNLVSYPENQTLMAYLVGIRGTAGRAAIDDAGAIAGLASLAGPYAAQIAYYESRFPGTSAPGQLLQLGLTDTVARLIMDTFAELAAEYGVYLSVCSNLAPFEKITGADTLLLADPEADTSYAYRATAPEIYNRNFIFGPDGQLLTIQDKAYLVPIEREQGAGLGLVGIETYQIPVFDLPFARVGTVISKDAWMPDVNDRLDQLGAELLIQPEAFSTWGVGGDDLWPPDKFQRGGWWMVQKHPSVEANVTPMLTGNLGDLVFDGQPLIAVEGGDASRCLMGQAREPGWAAVGVWSDYLEPLALCDEARRGELEEQGLALQPGSGDARENLYADDVVFADIQLPAKLTAAPRLAPAADPGALIGTPGAALTPKLSHSDGRIWLSWIDSFGERRQSLALSHSQDGATWSTTLDLGASVTNFDHFDNDWSPAPLALSAQSMVLAHTAFPTENWDLFAWRIDISDDTSAIGTVQTRVDDAESDGGVNRERGHSSPRLIPLPDGGILAIWSDLRWPWIKPQVRFSLSSDGGANWSPSRRADGGLTSFEAEQLDARDPGESRGQSFPDALALNNGRILLAWQEADQTGTPQIVTSLLGTDGSISAPLTLSATRANYRPRLSHDGQQPILIQESRDAAGGLQLTYRRFGSNDAWSAPAPVDPSAHLGHHQRYAEPLHAQGRLWIAYNDDRAGDDDVLLIALGDAQPQRLDAAPVGVKSLAPSLVALDDGRLLAAWQEEGHDGPSIRIKSFAAPQPRVRGGSGALWLSLPLLLLCLGRRSRQGSAARNSFGRLRAPRGANR